MPNLLGNIKLSLVTFISRIISGSIVYIVLARILSVEDFGLLSFGTTFAGLLTVMAEFGFSLMAQRDIPQNRFPLKEYVYNTFVQKFAYSGVAVIGGVIYLIFLYSGMSVTIGLIFLINAIVTSNNMYLFSVLRAKNMFKYESLVALSYSVVLIILLGVFFLFHLDILFIAYGLLFARLAQTLILIPIFLKEFGWLSLKINKNIQQYLFKNSFSFGAHYIIGVFYFSIDSQLIFYYKGGEALAVYQALFKLVLILLSVVDLLNNVFIPYLSVKLHKSVVDFKVIVSSVNKAVLTLGLFLFVSMNLFAGDVLHILYADKYNAALSIVFPLSFVLLFRIVASIYAALLTISDHQNIRVLIVSVSLVINVLLNLWIIPLHGFIGAAYVSMITHLVLVSLYVLFSLKYYHSILIDRRTGLFLMVTLILTILVYSMNLQANTLISIGILLAWISSLYLIYNQKQIIHIKEIFMGSYH